MLIHAEGINRGDAPVKVYHANASDGFILVGDARTRILLTHKEVLELHSLLEPFVRSHPRELSTPDGDPQPKE